LKRRLLLSCTLVLATACNGGALTVAPTVDSRHRSVLTSTPASTFLPSLTIPTSLPTAAPTRVPTPTGEPDVVVDCAVRLADSPPAYGTNGWWTDEDADMWRARYAELSPQIVRLPLLHQFLEPVNDDDDPTHVRWDGFWFNRPISWFGRTLTYRYWLETLRDLDVTLMLYVPYLAGWLSANGDQGLYSTYPPQSLAEYHEFVRAALTFAVNEAGYPPERIILEPVNEPDLRCGQDPEVPCFWRDWAMDDLVAVMAEACRAADEVDERIRVVGLSECCGVELTRVFLEEYGGGECLEGLTYHRYVYGEDFGDGLARGGKLQAYGKPVYLNEFGSTKYWSNGIEGALWHSATVPQLWEAGINIVQFPISEWPGTRSYSHLGLFADWTGDWATKPAYWVYVNFYTHFGGTEIVSVTASPDTFVSAGRRAETGALAVWLTSATSAKGKPITFQIINWPANRAAVTVYDNLVGSDPVAAFDVAAQDWDGQLTFDYVVPAHSSFSFLLRMAP
jgi:hypothetical protein